MVELRSLWRFLLTPRKTFENDARRTSGRFRASQATSYQTLGGARRSLVCVSLGDRIDRAPEVGMTPLASSRCVTMKEPHKKAADREHPADETQSQGPTQGVAMPVSEASGREDEGERGRR
ncbi:hypothetical protein MGYG_01692 [Nannizzia gypsea CBS 118893]|uniref:Uncharacterized protein n=1 Tax=Arthroderma gypseum (strain ATCC MYA-4604 / CBS 118893) TaxID=535722 RepID=E5R2L3_ARTGP|nr:hypothetical protein MGYG_01692 [Nannizzia gypsea CBS 118893]EFQ98671.1 hypothetical protein MGYG_01692 [Nannizzia gypsea CBS 118893]